ncbi:hypothetical protein [Alkalibacillus aidingensis]|uniref:hypothetical protein n=1 Tax=Alkalibacillus aidingensis TaxID=2747607 RepID=UPI001CB6F73E|nr:hypothetical protein [Alkalibacillus aidingensis]
MEQKLDTLTESIYHQKTKEYFREVLSSYKNGNYRSAVVMLYTVVICDLVFKLNDLKDIHNDEKAKKILQELEVQKEEDPVSPDWENKLIEKSFKEAKLLENDVYTHITTLKKYRNLSGHPVLNSLEILYTPNEELTKSLIINMLEGLLNKHPLLTKNVFLPFVLEIERIKNDFPTEERLTKYLESKFLVYSNRELVEYIFKHLWKLVFKKNSKRESDNRDINFRVLLVIYKKYEQNLFENIKKESTYFSDFLDGDAKILTKLVDFLAEFPNIYNELHEHAQEILKIRIKDSKKLTVKGTFLFDTLEEHLNHLDSKLHSYGTYINQPYIQTYLLKNGEITFLLSKAGDKNIEDFYDLMISHYYHSGSYDAADITFEHCIRPFFTGFNKKQMKRLLSEVNDNPQCYDGRYGGKNKVLLETAKELLGDEVEEEYKNLFS